MTLEYCQEQMQCTLLVLSTVVVSIVEIYFGFYDANMFLNETLKGIRNATRYLSSVCSRHFSCP